jgi:hypothetical protein
MKQTNATSPERFRRGRYGAAAFGTLLLAALLSSGCNPGTDYNSGPTPQPTPSQGGVFGDTPIVISGGSTEIEMNPLSFKPVAGNANKFSSTVAGKFKSVIVYDDAENAKEEDLISFVIPGSGKCSVILQHKDGAITMSNESTEMVEVEFDTSKIKPRLRTPSGKTPVQHFSRKMKLTGIEVKAGGSAVFCQDYQGVNTPCKLPQGGRFTVEVWFQ